AGLTVACDAMYGAMAGFLPRVLSGDATETVEINTAHNPLFPGLTGPEPVERNLTRLKRVVADGDATIGIAFDGDGDRIGVVDERGRYVSAQQVFALLARYVLDVRRDRRPIVKSVTGTAMVERLAEKAGVAVVETPTGFPHISQAMVEEGAALGGEESGGFAFGFHLPERDGLLSALLLLDYVLHAGRPISELVAQIEADIGPWCYERVDLELEAETRAAAVARLHGARWPTSIAGLNVRRILTVDGTKIEFEDGSWLLVRPSGTEPLLRLYAEAHDPETVGALLAAARDILKV
ncbi:MAG: phosphoglucomutase/phosphomannomutase family protein, partial [Thermomicrobiaceae bacterium]|nr:phosphoglucomutase/phosphomannomutase family protein [Thermomicrobiaceae bacterium]